MAILGALLKRGIQLKKVAQFSWRTPERQQLHVLHKLMTIAQATDFGRKYHFTIMLSKHGNRLSHLYRAYSDLVPLYTYNTIFKEWWHKSLAGKADVCWPGKVKYFALSSGTSEAATKHIPITTDMSRHIRKTGVRQILTLIDYDLPPSLFTRGILMLGGSTHLSKVGFRYEGDLSGIQAKQIPLWFQPLYKPGKRIAAEADWNHKLDEIVRTARDWDIGYIVGVPAWLQILLERIIEHYKVDTIHDIWPNLAVFTHGGVAFEPYRKGFEKLLARPLIYLETYLASEGFIAYQARQGAAGMKLVTDIGIFYEFIPFNEQNFDADGELLPNARPLHLGQVEEGVEYALLLTTCAGTWRYQIGDVIRFTNLAESEIVITGRTKHFLSLCGEHLSVDNMNRALLEAGKELGFTAREFTVAGVPDGTLFAHHWYIGTDDSVSVEALTTLVDDRLKLLNDDYRIERLHALKNVKMHILPVAAFYDFLKEKGKEGGQVKFPRVIKKSMYEDWQSFLGRRGFLNN
jgi:hypothetical protein